MQKTARQAYNEAFTEEKYQELVATIHRDFPGQLDFRAAESPVFVPHSLKAKLIEACEAFIDVIAADNFKDLTDRAIPAHQRVPNENDHTSFLAIDFAICRDEQGELTPQLIELQGFPSIFGYQAYLCIDSRST